MFLSAYLLFITSCIDYKLSGLLYGLIKDKQCVCVCSNILFKDCKKRKEKKLNRRKIRKKIKKEEEGWEDGPVC